MMINKHKFSVQRMKKVLHKHGKQWIVISAALLMMLGGSALATNVSHADANGSQTSSAKVVPANQPMVIAHRAANLHSQILNHADQVQDHQTAIPKNTAGTMSAPKVTTYSNNGVARLQKLQKLYSMYEMLVKSGVFSDSGKQTPNRQPVQPSNQPNQPSANHSGNQVPKTPSNRQPAKQDYVTGTRYGLNYKYDRANQSVEFMNGSSNFNGSDSLFDAEPLSGATSAKVNSDCDFSKVTNISYLFSNAHHLRSLTLPSSFDASNVSDMGHMFASDSDLQSLTMPTLDTSGVTNMSDMFGSDMNLHSLTLPNSFNTSDVSNMDVMFGGDSNLRSLILPSSFTAYNATNTSDMFASDVNLQIPNIPGLSDRSDTQASDNVPSDHAQSDHQPSSSDSQVQQTLQQMKTRVLSDINNDRAKNGQPALQLNANMNKIADQRAQQIEKKFTHYDQNGNSYYLEDADHDGIPLRRESASGENIGMQWFSPVTFTPNFGAQIADGTDHSMMYDDASSNWGHRANILSPNYQVVGIGTAYNGNGSFYITEDFAAGAPSDSNK